MKHLLILSLLPGFWVTGLRAGSGGELLEAAREGDGKTLRLLLREPVDVNVSQGDGATPLAWAVHRDDLEAVDLLIGAGADVNTANVYGVTPLILACTNRSEAMVRKLLRAGADPNRAETSGETPLMHCARTGTREAVKSLLVQGAQANAKGRERGQTALMWAAAQGRPEIAGILVEHGADVEARSHRLSLYQPRIPEGTQLSPKGLPVHQGFRDTIYHPQFKGGFTALMFAAQAGDAQTARILLAAGAGVDVGTPEQGTPLVLAASYGREEVALLLLEKGADPNATDGYGLTALHWALQEGIVALAGGHTETDPYWTYPNSHRLVRALLDHGADPDARARYDFMPYHIHRFGRGAQQEPPQISQVGATPFLLAAAGGDAAAMRILLEADADPNLGTLDGATPLMVAAGMGVNLGMRGSDGVTKAIREKALESVRLAWEAGNDVNAVGPDDRRAVHGAALYGLTDVISFLAEKGADLEARDMWGQTAMSIAMADPDGLVYRHLPDRGQDSTFRRRSRKDPATMDRLLSLGAAPYVVQGRDLTGF